MKVVDTVRALLDEAVGTRGALRNCRNELGRNTDAIRQVERLGAQLPRRVVEEPAPQRTSA